MKVRYTKTMSIDDGIPMPITPGKKTCCRTLVAATKRYSRNQIMYYAVVEHGQTVVQAAAKFGIHPTYARRLIYREAQCRAPLLYGRLECEGSLSIKTLRAFRNIFINGEQE